MQKTNDSVYKGKTQYILKFKKLYKKKEGKDLTDQEALEDFEKLTTLVNAIYKPIPKRIFDGSCCPICQKSIDKDNFIDSLSKKEFLLSGLCQKCQDETFK